MAQADIETIIRRIAHLMNRTEARGATPEEAATAAARVQALLLKHNLDMATVQAKTGDKSEYTKDWFRFHPKKAGGYIACWRQLAGAVAGGNFCRVVSVVGTGDGFIVGEQVNVAAVVAMYNRLQDTLERMATQAWLREDSGERLHRDAGIDGVPLARQSMSWKRAYLFGAVRVIDSRLQAERKRAEEQHTQQDGRETEAGEVRALVVIKDKEVGEALARFFPVVGKARVAGIGYLGADADAAGARDAATVDLHGRASLDGSKPTLEAGDE